MISRIFHLAILSIGLVLFDSCTKEVTQPTSSETGTLDIGLIAFYPFSGSAADSSGNANDGIAYGPVLTADRFGNANKAYDFTPTASYIDISRKPLHLTGNESRTFSAWVKSNENPISQSQPGMMIISSGQGIDKVSAENNGKTFNLRVNADAGGWRFSFMGYSLNNDFDINPTSGDLVTNKWTHIATTYKQDTIKLYINGKFQTERRIVLNTTGNDNFIGKNNHIGYESFFKGKIDDVRIYNRALTLSEIRELASK